MPVEARLNNSTGRYCIYEEGTNRLTRGSNGQTFCHDSMSSAEAQATAINIAKENENKANHEDDDKYKSFSDMVDEANEKPFKLMVKEFKSKVVPQKYSNINFKPTQSMANAAKRALKLRDEQPPSNKGMTRVGLERANQLINMETLSPTTVKRMFSFFSRHEVDKNATGFRQGEEGYPSKGLQAWLGWGGDPGFAWARKIVNQMEAADRESS